MIVRDFAEADIDAVVALWRRCGLVVPWHDPVRDSRLALDSGHGAVLVGVDGPRIVAAVMVGHDGHRGWLYYLAVEPRRSMAIGYLGTIPQNRRRDHYGRITDK